MTDHNATKYVKSAHEPLASDYSTQRIAYVCSLLHDPQKNLKFIRLAGSNGKTICASLLSSVLTKAGYKTLTLTMSRYDDPRDNIKIGGVPVLRSDFTSYTSEVASAVSLIKKQLEDAKGALDETNEEAEHTSPLPQKLQDGSLGADMSRRELLLTIALLCARAYGCDICIIESAHNDADPSLFLPTPIATVICGAIPRSDKVQMAKIKTYFTHGLSDVISAPQDRESYKTIADACSAIGCRLTMPVRSSLKIKHLSLMGTSFQYQGEEYRLGLCGRFQATNATTAIECVKVLRRHGYDIPHECEVSGLESVRIPAKFELISLKPTIIADSTYKLEAVDTVCESLFDFSELTGQDISLCLPADAPLIEKYFDMLTDRGYTIRSIYTVCSEEAEKLLHASLPLDIMLAAFKTEGALVKRVLGGLNSDALLLVSGPFSFTDKIRAEIKSFLAF